MILAKKRPIKFSPSIETVKKLRMQSLLCGGGSPSNFVLMPWNENKEIIIKMGAYSKSIGRWELIQNLLDLSHSIDNPTELINMLKSYNQEFDNSKNEHSQFGNYLVLQKYFSNLGASEMDNFFSVNGILSTIRNLALKLKELVPKLEILQKGFNGVIKLHQMQVASLLANAFLCTFPKGTGDCPSINFNRLYERGTDTVMACNIEKIKCIIHYFKRIHMKEPTGNLTFHRLCISDHKFPRWDKTSTELCFLEVNSTGKIEDQKGYVHVDFANKYVGGGVLGRGCVQEEIRFVICPELIVSRLFTECLTDNEALLVIGAERFCNYSGYSNTFQFAGDHQDKTPFDKNLHRKSYLTIVDALCFHRFSEQFRESKILRELKKAYVGFKPLEDWKTLPLATGNWGCGAFGGDPQLKALIQLMASSQAGRNMLYLTFGDDVLRKQIEELYACLRKNSINIGMLYRIVRQYNKERKKNQTVFQYVQEAVEKFKNRRFLASFHSQFSSEQKNPIRLSPFRVSPEPFYGRSSESGERNYETSTSCSEKDQLLPDMKKDFQALPNDFIVSSSSGSAPEKTLRENVDFIFQPRENEKDSAEKNSEDVSENDLSQSMFSETDDELPEQPETFQACPGVVVPEANQSDRIQIELNDETKIFKERKLVQKKITDCFFKK